MQGPGTNYPPDAGWWYYFSGTRSRNTQAQPSPWLCALCLDSRSVTSSCRPRSQVARSLNHTQLTPAPLLPPPPAPHCPRSVPTRPSRGSTGCLVTLTVWMAPLRALGTRFDGYIRVASRPGVANINLYETFPIGLPVHYILFFGFFTTPSLFGLDQ